MNYQKYGWLGLKITILLLVLIGVYLVILFIINNKNDEVIIPTKEPEKTEDENVYYINLDEATKKKLLDIAETIKTGDTYESVIAKMGKPDSDQEVYAKERPVFLTRTVEYYLKQKKKNWANERDDESITFFFDKNNFLKTKVIHINGISTWTPPLEENKTEIIQ